MIETTHIFKRRLVGMLGALPLLAGCAATDGIGYYAHTVKGHLAVLNAARPVSEVLADALVDERVKLKLRSALEIRKFASEKLGLPDNASYTRYADLKRDAVVWNVFAAPPTSLKLENWCFLVVGCVSYRGYYDRQTAEAFAAGLAARGLDTYVGAVPAYSTLGWFSDPLLNTFILYPDAELARLVFHELTHQLLYIKGDSTFNESFATAVEEIGVERWLAQQADPKLRAGYEEFAARRRDFQALLLRYRERLESVYRDAADDAQRLAGKQRVLAELHDEYRTIKQQRWGGFAGYDRYFAQQIGNAHLAAVATYTSLLPAFRALYRREGEDIAKFLAAARELAAKDRTSRDAELAALVAQPG